ncbi:MAG: hypothetical protein LBF68_02740 [Christensenellaceae bacterium]|jgi:hypothetical protein|nr:hypothetical protein [Christensenellaceae bacterium]
MTKLRSNLKRLSSGGSIIYIVILAITIFVSAIHELTITKEQFPSILDQLGDYSYLLEISEFLNALWILSMIITIIVYVVVFEIIIAAVSSFLKRNNIRLSTIKTFKNLTRLFFALASVVMGLIRLLYFVAPVVEAFDGLINFVVYGALLFLAFLVLEDEFIYLGQIGSAYAMLSKLFFIINLVFALSGFIQISKSTFGVLLALIGTSLYVLATVGGFIFSHYIVAKRFMQKQHDFLDHEVIITPIDYNDDHNNPPPPPPSDIYRDFGF